MARTFTASDRASLIRLATTLPKGSEERKTLLSALGVSSSKQAHIGDQTLDQLVDMAVESVGGDPTNSDFTPALKRYRDQWNNAVEDALDGWVSNNMDKFDLEARPFAHIRGEADADDIVEVLLEHRGGAGFLYFMEMEGAGVGTWDGDWDQLFQKGSGTVTELSRHMANKLKRPYQNLKNEIDEIGFASVPEDEDGYEDDTYKRNRYAARGALIRLAASLPKGSEERKVILASVQRKAGGKR